MDETCGDCKHFHLHPQPDARTVTIGEPRPGDCRYDPPKLIPIMGATAQGPQLIGQICAYPAMTEIFPACSKFEASKEEKNSFHIQMGKS